MGFELPNSFEVPKPEWGQSAWVEPTKPAIENEDEKRQLFGIELARTNQPFQAACNVCGNNTNEALWIAKNWLNDPIVLASKDLYLKTVDNDKTLLDKEQLASRLLKIADEKNATNAFYILDGKDRLAALRLYAEIRQFIGKTADITPTSNVFNQITVKFVEPDKKEKILEHIAQESEPVKLKLVG